MTQWDVPADMAALEARLLDLGAHLDVPATPPLAERVRGALRTPVAPRAAMRPGWSRRLAAVAMAVALLLGASLAVPPVRTAVAHWLGIRGVEITPVQTLPPRPTRTPGPTSSIPGDALGLGIATTLAGADRRLGFVVAVPTELGAPDAVWVRDEDGGVATLVYLPRPGLPASAPAGVGLLLTEFRATAETPIIGKFVGPDTKVLPITLGADQGYWLSGAPHEIAYMLPEGGIVVQSLRLAGDTLLLQHGPLSVRIESGLDMAHAEQVAGSLP